MSSAATYSSLPALGSKAPPRGEAGQLAAGIAVGSIIGMPLLYTMEVWWRGMLMSPWRLLGVLGIVLVLNWFFCAVSGFRPEHARGQTTVQAITSVGIAIVFSWLVLWLIGSISLGGMLDGRFAAVVGPVLLAAAAVSLGIAFANAHMQAAPGKAQKSGYDAAAGNDSRSHVENLRRQLREDLLDVVATVAGAMLFSLNIAPTEEAILIATRLPPWQLLVVLAATIVLCYIILYGSGFEKQPVHVASLLQRPWIETLLTVGVSLAVAGLLLWMLGQLEATSTLPAFVSSVVVLGLPAAVGGAAGRLAI